MKFTYDFAEFDLDKVIAFIQSSYWGNGRSRADILTSFDNSAIVGMFDGDRQVGMARAVSDGVFHTYVFDLFVFEEFRGHGFSKDLMTALLEHPDLENVTGWMLSTRDAHGLYHKYGFQPVDPDRTMWMKRP
ncbi:GNAT family N-acetyltransferase [uncultured Shimia sp.]|uniref:GNAT family N-acetyltransferase n=1 Tax=uncultured Shimia sp. TaxID=573152 RepID=UPI00262C43F0|nr:GNAT family N-acetyltransferase [uncultured Shimia sp.]